MCEVLDQQSVELCNYSVDATILLLTLPTVRKILGSLAQEMCHRQQRKGWLVLARKGDVIVAEEEF